MTMENPMRTILGISTAAALLLAPVASLAEPAGHQTTGTQTEFRQSVKALPHTHKRQQIIRSELNKNEPNVAK
jgi:hypothetical protein